MPRGASGLHRRFVDVGVHPERPGDALLAVRVVGGTRSQYVRCEPSGSGVELTTSTITTSSSSASAIRHRMPVSSRCTGWAPDSAR